MIDDIISSWAQQHDYDVRTIGSQPYKLIIVGTQAKPGNLEPSHFELIRELHPQRLLYQDAVNHWYNPDTHTEQEILNTGQYNLGTLVPVDLRNLADQLQFHIIGCGLTPDEENAAEDTMRLIRKRSGIYDDPALPLNFEDALPTLSLRIGLKTTQHAGQWVAQEMTPVLAIIRDAYIKHRGFNDGLTEGCRLENIPGYTLLQKN